jgi:hypothetical protein
MTKRSQRRKLELYGVASDGRTAASVTAPVNVTAPAIIGTLKVGTPVACNPGTWTGTYASTFFQWKINGISIPGATSAGYTPVASDGTKTLTCLVTVTNPKGSAQLGATGGVVAP